MAFREQQMKPFFVLIVSFFMLLRCGGDFAGAGSETTNGVVGSIFDENERPAVGAVVKLFVEGHDPVSCGVSGAPLIDTVDDDGKFVFNSVAPGRYSIVARNESMALALRIDSVEVGRDTVTTLPAGTLNGCGAVVADFSGDDSIVDSSGYVYIPGTDIFSFIDKQERAVLMGVPAGRVAVVMGAFADNQQRNILRSPVSVESDDTAYIDRPAWSYSRRLYFNTTASGAAIMEELHNFPVLVRLHGGNFDFSEAATDGRDLRFVGDNGRELQFQIERWDMLMKHAEIWVLADTLRSNSADQFVTMYWGNAGALFTDRGSAVFDTANEFQGVWHLGDAAQDSIHDATHNGYNGGSPDSARPQPAEGVIGACRSFNGESSFINMPNTAGSTLNFPEGGYYTVSAWVLVESSDELSHVVVSKGNNQYFLWLTSIHLDATLWEFADYQSDAGWDLSTQSVSFSQWVMLTGVRDGSAQHLYVNGEAVDTLVEYPFIGPRSETSDLMIGRFAQFMESPTEDQGYCFFTGNIDEVRICSSVRSAAWIRACYMNQKPDDRLVVFE